MSGDPEQEYFADGMTEDIITELTKISGLFVIARHSVFTYKGTLATLKSVGRELGVRYALEGSVRRAGNRLRITAQLVDTVSNLNLWADQYDRDLHDVFAVQSEVARNVASAMAVALRPDEISRINRPPTDNFKAYDLYLRSRATPFPPTRENILNAQRAYEHITDIDPNFVGGHAGSALTHAMAVIFGVSPQPEIDAADAISKAKKALSLDNGFAQAHSALGLGYLAAGKHDQAVASTRKATALQPGDADTYSCLGIALLFAGDCEGASDAAEQALRLDPQYTNGPYLNLLGTAKLMAGKYVEAIDAFERNVARGGPMGPPMLHGWAAAYVAEGRIEEAQKTAVDLLKFLPEFSLKNFRFLYMYKNDEDRSHVIGLLRKLDLPE